MVVGFNESLRTKSIIHQIQIFYEVKQILNVKTTSLNLDDSLKPNSLNPGSTVFMTHHQGGPLYLLFTGDSRSRQIWNGVYEYLKNFEQPKLTAMEILTKFKTPRCDIIWNGNVDIKEYNNGEPHYVIDKGANSRNLAHNFRHHLVPNLDYAIVNCLQHDMIPVNAEPDPLKRRRQWPNITSNYRSNIASVMKQVSSLRG